MKTYKLHLPDTVMGVMKTIENAGYEVFCVGGAVRDEIMGKKPTDYDLASSAPTDKIISLFKKTVPTGIQHGTVTVVESGMNIEVTRYRIDGEYSDHRSPDSVSYTSNFIDDLMRRDFTVNAIGYNEKVGIFDPFCGIDDIKNKIIRTVGDAEKRFSEDALRILRAIRFSANLNFSIEKNTLDAIIKNAGDLSKISGERIAVELIKTLSGDHPEMIDILSRAGGFSHLGISCTEKAQLLNSIPKIDTLRFAVFCILSNVNCADFSKALRFSNKFIKSAAAFEEILKSDRFCAENIKPFASFIPYDELKYSATAYSLLHGEDTEAEFIKLEKAAKNNEPYSAAMLDICGEDLMKLDLSGKEIGKAMEILLTLVLSHPEMNKKSTLLEEARKSIDFIKK